MTGTAMRGTDNVLMVRAGGSCGNILKDLVELDTSHEEAGLMICLKREHDVRA